MITKADLTIRERDPLLGGNGIEKFYKTYECFYSGVERVNCLDSSLYQKEQAVNLITDRFLDRIYGETKYFFRKMFYEISGLILYNDMQTLNRLNDEYALLMEPIPKKQGKVIFETLDGIKMEEYIGIPYTGSKPPPFIVRGIRSLGKETERKYELQMFYSKNGIPVYREVSTS